MRLPSKEEFYKLCECQTKFDKDLKGRWFFDEETEEKLFLPYAGYRNGTTISLVGSNGYYWLSTYNSRGKGLCYSEPVYQKEDANPCYGLSIRLVSDEPFEGAVHVADN